MSKTTKEIYLKAFMLLQKDKKNPELDEKWFSEGEIKKALDESYFNKENHIMLEDVFFKKMGFKDAYSNMR